MNAFIPEVIANVIAIAIASGIVLVLFPPDAYFAVLLPAAVLFTILGGLGGDSLGDAIITSLIIVCVLVVFYLFVPLDGLVKQVPISALIGGVTGKLTLAIYTEFMKPESYLITHDNIVPSEYDSITKGDTVSSEYDSITKDNTVPSEYDSITKGDTVPSEYDSITKGDTVPSEYDSITKGNIVLREYDTVRVISLESETRDYDGSDGVCRAPRVGDEAVICYEYNPDDPTAMVAVEKVDCDGLTIWLADFKKSELALVYRPAG